MRVHRALAMPAPPRLVRIVGVFAVLLLTGVLSAQELWYASYQQAVDALKRGEYAVARRKLVNAITNTQAPKSRGRKVQYYGLLRDEFIPEYYLALIAAHEKQWNEAIRYADAAEPYMRGDRDFDTLMAARTSAVNALGARPPSTTPPPSSVPNSAPPVTSRPENASPSAPATTSVPVVDARVLAQRRAALLLTQANAALEGGAFADARGLAGQARALGVDIAAANAMLTRIVTAERAARNAQAQRQITTLLEQRNWAAAGEQLDTFARDGGEPAFVTSTRAAIARGLDQDAARGLEHAAVTAFYKGNYQAALGTFARMSASQITPRVLFYQACTNAALALLEGPAGASRLTRARALYARSDPKHHSFQRHRRFVSPEIIRALEQ